MLIWQYKGKPKANATIGATSSEFSSVFQSAVDVGDILNIDKATGYALDLVGYHVGVFRTLESFIPRSFFGFHKRGGLAFGKGVFYRIDNAQKDSKKMTDEEFRFIIKARIMKNYQLGTIEDITASISALFGGESRVIDNYDMTMTAIIPYDLMTEFKKYAIQKLDVIVRPVGVMYKYVIIKPVKYFGFYKDASASGFGVGKFARFLDVNTK